LALNAEHIKRKPDCARFIPSIDLLAGWNKCGLRQFSIGKAIKTNGAGYESV
jgi:hypothetical protein